MSDIVPIPTSWLRIVAAAIALFVVGVFFLGRCSAPDPAPLPAKTQQALERHVIASVLDTAATHRLENDTAVAGQKQRAAAAAQRTAEARAKTEKARADLLEKVAALAKTAQDSATAYHAALNAEKSRASSLEQSVASAGAQLQAAAARQAATDSIADVWKIHAFRADSLVAQLLPLAEQRDRCRILWVASCPTRKQVAIGGALVGATAALVATGKIKIPISLKFF